MRKHFDFYMKNISFKIDGIDNNEDVDYEKVYDNLIILIIELLSSMNIVESDKDKFVIEYYKNFKIP